jgi:cobalt/nickel transport protein
MAFDLKENIKKNKGLYAFAAVALAVALILGIFVSPFASSSPDGLDKTAESKGFAEKAKTVDASKSNSPLADYAVRGVKNEKVSTGLSGLIGVIITLLVALAVGIAVYGLGRIWGSKKEPDKGTTGTAPSET